MSAIWKNNFCPGHCVFQHCCPWKASVSFLPQQHHHNMTFDYKYSIKWVAMFRHCSPTTIKKTQQQWSWREMCFKNRRLHFIKKNYPSLDIWQFWAFGATLKLFDDLDTNLQLLAESVPNWTILERKITFWPKNWQIRRAIRHNVLKHITFHLVEISILCFHEEKNNLREGSWSTSILHCADLASLL